jgi:16S rRNA (adenine1518-N6/adenine1519-N6)-dimethyltransferase
MFKKPSPNSPFKTFRPKTSQPKTSQPKLAQPGKSFTPNPLFEEARRLRLKRRFSQNFLINQEVLDRTAALMQLGPDETVLEIGPGAGFLTERLLAAAPEKLIAVELDRRMHQYLQAKLPPDKHPRLDLIQHDILSFDFARIDAPTFKVVGNLPYAITSKILFLLAGELEQSTYPLRDRLRQITVMVQREVAERITAIPGQRAYNPLSIALQFRFETRLDFIVPSNAFYPAPKVESAIITLVPRSGPMTSVDDMVLLGRLVRAAFSQKRKTIRNALIGASFATPERIDQVFEATGISNGLRAEAISVQSFGELSNAFGANACQG